MCCTKRSVQLLSSWITGTVEQSLPVVNQPLPHVCDILLQHARAYGHGVVPQLAVRASIEWQERQVPVPV